MPAEVAKGLVFTTSASLFAGDAKGLVFTTSADVLAEMAQTLDFTTVTMHAAIDGGSASLVHGHPVQYLCGDAKMPKADPVAGPPWCFNLLIQKEIACGAIGAAGADKKTPS